MDEAGFLVRVYGVSRGTLGKEPARVNKELTFLVRIAVTADFGRRATLDAGAGLAPPGYGCEARCSAWRRLASAPLPHRRR